MNPATISFLTGNPAAILDRHAIRRTTGIPTVSLLVGPMGAAVRTFRRWVAGTGKSVIVANRDLFPEGPWIRCVAEQIDLPTAAVQCLAQRAARDPEEFLAEWRIKSNAEWERFWNTLAPKEDDDLLRSLAEQAIDPNSRNAVAASLCHFGDRVIPWIACLAPSALWPSVLFSAASVDDLSSVSCVAVQWAMRVPALSIAVAVPAEVWVEYLATAKESRAKAILREGVLAVPFMVSTKVVNTLAEAGVTGGAAAAIAANGTDEALLESAVAAVRAIATPPITEAEDDRARSAAERFLFTFLESLPETAGGFELNASLDFCFGPRPAEVDLLCRSPKIAIELDGYFHFLRPDGYRRDRLKDWELQRRGFVVLRFLAEDVIPHIEIIRDRILDALNLTPPGGHH